MYYFAVKAHLLLGWQKGGRVVTRILVANIRNSCSTILCRANFPSVRKTSDDYIDSVKPGKIGAL